MHRGVDSFQRIRPRAIGDNDTSITKEMYISLHKPKMCRERSYFFERKMVLSLKIRGTKYILLYESYVICR